MEFYENARPELCAGKKILYVHGFASSGQSGTVRSLRTLLPETTFVAPDLPVEPADALSLLKDVCEAEKPDIVIGTSMGGMFTEQLHGFDRICVNPAFHLADTILKNNGLGRQEFHSPRADGVQGFMVTKGLLEAFREVSAGCFESEERCLEERDRVWGLFGTEDKMVNCFDEFASHYRQAVWFEGEHYLNDHALLHAVLPVIQRIDDRQEGRKKRSVMINFDGALSSAGAGPVNGAVKAFHSLSRKYDVFVLDDERPHEAEKWGSALKWLEHWIGVEAWDRLVVGAHKELLMGDYLIDAHPENCGGEEFMGTLLHFGKEPFRNWDEVVEFFERLGGQ